MFDFEEALKRSSEQTVLCVGDLMLDDFVYGEVARISPEAPAPVLAVTQQRAGRRRRRQRRAQRRRARRALHVRRRGRRRRGRPRCCAALRREPLDRSASGGRPLAADHAQGAFRLRASLDPPAARRLGTGDADRGARSKQAVIDQGARGAAARRRASCCPTTPRACSPARHPRRDRSRAQSSASR